MNERFRPRSVPLFTILACLSPSLWARDIDQPHAWAEATYIESQNAYQYVVNLLPPESEGVAEPPYTVTAQAKYCAAAQEMMHRVYEMTDGAHRIFQVHFYHHSGNLPGVRHIDWFRQSGTAHVSTWGGVPSGPIQMYDGLLGCVSTFEAQNGAVVNTGNQCTDPQYTCVDEENSPFGRMACFDGDTPVERPGSDWGWTLAHEAGHWFYAASDEYFRSGALAGFGVCIGDEDNNGTDQTSIMAARNRNHMCDDETHVNPLNFEGVDVDNPESRSAWDLADDFWPDLTGHIPGVYPALDVDAVPPVSCVFHEQALNDTLLVLDRSGSMGYQDSPAGPTALEQAIEAALGFYNTSTPDRAAGVLGFNASTSTLIDYQPFDGQIVDEINVNPNGSTDICEAITTAADMIRAANPDQAHGVAVLLSDGLPTTANCDSEEEVLEAAWDACHGGDYPVSVFPIAFGDADPELLQKVATVCAGEMVVSGVQFAQALPTPHELKIDITRAAYKSRSQFMLMDELESMNQMIETNTFFVPAGSQELEVVWLGDGHQACDLAGLKFDLIAPSSATYDAALHSPVGAAETDYHTRTIRVSSPQAGPWTARVREIGPSFRCFPAGVVFGWQAHVKHQRLEARAKAEPAVAPRNAPVTLRAYLQFPKGHRASQIQAFGTVYHEGQQWPVVLADDGVAPDEVAGDGYYTETFNPDGFMLQDGGYRLVLGLIADEATAVAVAHPQDIPGEVISPTAPPRGSARVLVESSFVLQPCCDPSVPPASPSQYCPLPLACVGPSLQPSFGTLVAGRSYTALTATLSGHPIGATGAWLGFGPGIRASNVSATPEPTSGATRIQFDAVVDVDAPEGFRTLSLRYGNFLAADERSFQVAATAAGEVRATVGGGVQPLRLVKQRGGIVKLDWDPSCSSTDVDYAVYEGRMGDFASHAALTCSTGGATGFVVPEAGAGSYYLIVPLSENREGSYGVDSTGAERPVGEAACLVQSYQECTGGAPM